MTVRRRKRGFTLTELMVSLVVLGLVGSIVMALLVQAVKMYKKGFAEKTASDRAALALQVMLPEIREAINVDYPGPSRIEFTLPRKDNDGSNYVNPTTYSLEAGLQVCYYLSDATGGLETPDGPLLWRATKQPAETYFHPERVIAPGIDHLTITYAPSVDLLELVKVEVGVRAAAHPGSANRVIIGEVAMRNR